MSPVRSDQSPEPIADSATRIADALERIATELRLRNRADGVFPND